MSLTSDLKLKYCRQTVPTAGTRVCLVTGSPDFYKCKAIRIRAYSTNTGNIYIGDNRVISTDYSDILAPGEVWEARVPEPLWASCNINMTHIWLDADTNNNGVSFTAITESEGY